MLEALAGQAEHDLVAADRLVAGDLLTHLVGRAAQHVAVLDQPVEERSSGIDGGVGPRDGAWDRHRVVVHADDVDEVAAAALQGDLAGPLAIAQADDRVGHHDVVVLVLADLVDRVLDRFLVGVDPALRW